MGQFLFYDSKEFITIPILIFNNLTTIGKNSLSYIIIESLVLPSNLETIEEKAFFKSTINNISIPSVINILDNAFSYADIKSIHLPSTLQNISSHAFYHCQTLSEVEILGDIQFIGYSSFFECSSLSYFYYQGHHEPNYETPIFSDNITITVLETYEHDTFCGYPIKRISPEPTSETTSYTTTDTTEETISSSDDQNSGDPKAKTKKICLIVGLSLGCAIIIVIIIFVIIRSQKKNQYMSTISSEVLISNVNE
jgi:hypothetical protein